MMAPSRSDRWRGVSAPPLSLGGNADWQARAGIPVSVVMPLHRSVRRAEPSLLPVGRPVSLEIGARTEPFRLRRLKPAAGTPRVFFIEHDGYFDRPGLYGAGGQDFSDNGLRFGFFACAALAVLPRVSARRIVLHIHDWHAALAPV